MRTIQQQLAARDAAGGFCDIHAEAQNTPPVIQRFDRFRFHWRLEKKKHSRLGLGTGCDEVARKEFLLRDVRQALTASQKARDCLREK
jgi:hypothetical protein